MNNKINLVDDLNEINKQLSLAKAELDDLTSVSISDLADKKIQEIKDKIKLFLKKISSILSKVVLLSDGILEIKNGRVVCTQDIIIPSISFKDIDITLSVCEKNIMQTLKDMSSEGVNETYCIKLCKYLYILYDTYINSNKHKQYYETYYIKPDLDLKIPTLKDTIKRLESERKRLLDEIEKQKEEKEKMLNVFDFNKIHIEKNYVQSLKIPFAINDNEILSWNPTNDGILSFDVKNDSSNITINFIKAIMTRFLYSYPNLDKKFLYLSKKSNDEMNNFINRIYAISDELFFNKIKKLDVYNFESQLIDSFTSLRKTLEERSSLLDNEGFSNILEYNKVHLDNVKPLILVFINNYPNGFENCVDLDYFFENGKKTGIYFIVFKTSSLLKNNYSSEELLNPTLYAKNDLIISNDLIYCNDISYDLLSINNQNIDTLLEPFSKLKKETNNVVTYEDLDFGKISIDSKDIKECISIPIGKIENRIYNIEFAVSGKEEAKPIAYLLIGSPMMGKSSLIDSMIFNGSMKYSPDDLEFYLIDFKDGVSSATYGSRAKMPHIKVLAESSKQEEAEIILKTLINEQTRRNNIFKRCDCKNLADYNAKNSKHMPRIIVVIDEVQKLFAEDASDISRSDRLSKELEQIVREARSVGIHVVLASQDASRKMMNCVGKFVPGRFCFGAAIEDAENILNRENAIRVMNECTKPGIAMVSHDKGNTVEKIRLAYHENKEADYARKVRDKWKDYPINIAIVGEDGPLYALEKAKEESLFDKDEPSYIPIGESYYDHSIINVELNKFNHSLLILGENEKIQANILKSIMIGALRNSGEILLLDESIDYEIGDLFGNHPSVTEYNAKTYLNMLEKAYSVFKERSENRRQKFEPFYLILDGLTVVEDFLENKKKAISTQKKDNKKETDDDLPDWYDTSFKDDYSFDDEQDTIKEDPIYGADTLFKMLESLNKVNNFFIIFTVDKTSSLKRYLSVAQESDYIILHYPYVETMSQLVGNLYKNGVAQSCNENMALISEKGQSFMKFRYFKYDDDKETYKYIHNLGDLK